VDLFLVSNGGCLCLFVLIQEVWQQDQRGRNRSGEEKRVQLLEEQTYISAPKILSTYILPKSRPNILTTCFVFHQNLSTSYASSVLNSITSAIALFACKSINSKCKMGLEALCGNDDAERNRKSYTRIGASRNQV
jgi:hypothetical protein